MAKSHNLAYDYSAYDEQELVTSRKIKHRRNTAAVHKRNTTLRLIGLAAAALHLCAP